MHLQSAFPKTASRQKFICRAFASSGNRPERRTASSVWARRREKLASGKSLFNWNRDYDPGSGRYIQSDPDGIDAGNNTFSYVNGNPLKFVDSDGLQIALPVPALVPGGNNNACFACRKPKSDPYGLGLSDDESAPTFSLPNLDLNMAPPLLILVIGGASLMAAPGNQADTQITGDYGRAASDAKLKNCPPPDRCKWLEENASRYRPDQVKATQKAWGCRGSRPGKDKIKR